ncbi:MAG: hypothetical protein IRY84_18695, partial [Thermobispora bispora]|nr:hypothetical protein [Thermobispora bispora]
MSVVQGILAGSSARGVKGAASAGNGEGADRADAVAGRTVRGPNAARLLRPGRTPAAVVVAAVLALLGWVLTAVAVAAMLGVSPPRRLTSQLPDVTLAHPPLPA